MSELFQSGFRLGECTIDPRHGEIKRPNGTEHVTPKAMEILLCLVGNPEKLIEREELIRAGWGGGAHHEEALTRCIAELRHALGDHHDYPEYIQTVPRRGYRLVSSVKIPKAHAAAADTQRKSSDEDANSGSFWNELQRRNVVRSSLAYAAIAWLLIEVFSVIGGIFEWQTQVLRIFVVTAVIGLPIVIALS